MKRWKNSLGMAAGGALWLLAIGIGLAVLLDYEQTPGREGAALVHWPYDCEIKRDPARPTLVMFVHPRCPCTRASVGELARFMTHGQGRVSARVIFSKPPGRAEDWAQTDLWRSALAIPGVSVQIDGGDAAAKFRAETSGHTLLFDSQGRLIFSGGITSGRGHAGDNAGLNALEALLRGQPAGANHTPVFGCPLSTPDSLCKTTIP